MHCSATIKKINANIPQTFDFSLLIFLVFLLISPCKLLHSCTALSLASFRAFIKALTSNRLFLVCGMMLPAQNVRRRIYCYLYSPRIAGCHARTDRVAYVDNTSSTFLSKRSKHPEVDFSCNIRANFNMI